MNIRRQLIVTACVSSAIVLAIFTTLFLQSRQIDLALTRSEYAGRINTDGISGLRAVTVDYIMFRDQRPQAQWQQAHASLRTLLATNLYQGTAKQVLIEDLRKRNDYLGEIFPDLTKLYDARGAGAVPAALRREVEARLVTQLMVTTQEMTADVAQLTHFSLNHLSNVQEELNVALVVGVAILALLIGANLFIVSRSILKPISRLRRGAEIIGAGDLDFRTNISFQNEIGELSKAFDTMTSQLALSKAQSEKNAFRLQQTVQELESFSYSVSHDLRAPLRGIDGWSLALLEDYGAALDETARSYLNIVRTETQRMGHLIDDMLQLSRVTRGELRRTTVDVSELAQAVAQRLTDAQPARCVEFRIEPGLTANADTRLVEVALTNLLGNAMKFTGTRPAALIEFGSTVEAGADPAAQQRVFFVRDNGVGFDMAHAAKLFGAFQRLHAATDFPGTGIGLATVQRIVHRHGGTIRAKAQPDMGASFYFTLEEAP